MLVEDLRAVPLFEGLTPERQSALAVLFEPVDCAAGSLLFCQGDLALTMYVLVAGEVAIRFAPEDGGVLDIAVIHPGEVFGWSALLERAHYTSSAHAVSDTQALAAPGSSLRRLMRADPEMGECLLERMTATVPGTSGLRGQLLQLVHTPSHHAR
jgi:CRP-like cAMP-binding protein